MANLKDIRIRINSVKSTRQVTSAMKMVSAAKFKKAQDDVEHIRPFVGKLKEVVAFLGRSIDDAATSVRGFAADPKGKILIVSIASNKGLAGAFNANISKRTEMLLRHDLRHEVERGEVELLTIGKQVTKALGKVAPSVAKSNCDDLHDNLTTENVRAVAQRLSDAFFEGKYRSICVIYNEFVNAAVRTRGCFCATRRCLRALSSRCWRSTRRRTPSWSSCCRSASTATRAATIRSSTSLWSRTRKRLWTLWCPK